MPLPRPAAFIAFAAGLLVSEPAFAMKIAVVDFQTAVTQTTEGKAAQTKLDAMYGSRKGEIEKCVTDFQKQYKDFESRALLLSEAAQQAEGRDLAMKQQKCEELNSRYTQEMQKTYYELLADLDEKMRTMCERIAKEKAYDLVVDRAAAVYFGGEVIDMTPELVRRYNATTPVAP